MTSDEKKACLARCVCFLRDTADMLESGELDGTDPAGVVLFTDAGTLVYVPEEYLMATKDHLEGGVSLRGYGAKADEAKS